jgi:hypothetical protein
VTISGTINGAGFSCAGTGGATCSQPLSDGASIPITYSGSCSGGGTAGPYSDSYSQDSIAPTVTTSLSGGVLGPGTWYLSGPVMLTCNVLDALSGFGSVSYGTQTTGTADGTYPLSCTGYDAAGNSASASVTVGIDGTPPVITPTVSGGTLGAGGWYLNGPVSLSCAANDATSGVANVVYGTMTATDPGTTVLDCTAYDNAGNSSYYSIPITIDNIGPEASFTFSGGYCTGGWYNTPVHAYIVVNDLLSGGGHGIFQVDGEEWDSSREIKDGIHSITGTGWDLAGNAVHISETLQVDTYAPMSSFITESGSWVAGSVTLEGQSIDWTSGIKVVEISFDSGRTWIPIGGSSAWSYEWNTLNPETPVPDGSYTILARALDNACNQEHTGVITINVDNTPPNLELQDTINLMGRTTTVIATDAGSGVDHGTVTITGNGIEPVVIPFTSSTEVSWDGRGGDGKAAPFGLYEILVEVWDRVGNHSSAKGTWLRPAPVEPTATSVPPVAMIVVPDNKVPDGEAKDNGNVSLPPLAIPFWLLLLPTAALAVWITASGLALGNDRRWREIRGIRNAVGIYRIQKQTNISEEGEQ